MSDATANQAQAIRRYVRSQNAGKGISKSKAKVTGSRSVVGRAKGRDRTVKIMRKTAKQTRGFGTITQAALKRLKSKK